jgi:hypothetical protein
LQDKKSKISYPDLNNYDEMKYERASEREKNAILFMRDKWYFWNLSDNYSSAGIAIKS